MKPLVTRCQVALNLWLLCSEHTGSLPPVTLIGENDTPPPDAIIVHFFTHDKAVTLAARDLREHPLAVACCVGRDEDMRVSDAVNRQIDGVWTEFGNTGRLFGAVDDLARWVSENLAVAV